MAERSLVTPVIQLLKLKRVALGMTAREFARQIGAKPPTVCAWENGQRPVGVKWVPKIAAALQMDAEEFAKVLNASER